MEARETPFITFIQKPTQFVIPIYQRTYSWNRKQCSQLWDDIYQTSLDETIPGHFIGSIVYVAKGLYEISEVPQVLVIDGQQRLATLSLLMAALGKVMEEKESTGTNNRNKIKNNFLYNQNEENEKRYKLLLTQSDKDTFINIIDDRTPPENGSTSIIENYNYFLDKIRKTDIELDKLYKGICKLILVSISLDRTKDDPQLIFESLNSTGLKLSQADLIRNFILMGLEQEEQKLIYNNYWFPMERKFVAIGESEYFDKFMRHYLTVKTGLLPNINQVYEAFKEFWKSVSADTTEEPMKDIFKFSKYYTNLVSGDFEDKDISKIVNDINTLKMDVVYPFFLDVLDDYDKKVISRDEVLEIMRLSESYVFRRAICEVPTNSLNKTFASLAKEIDEKNYIESMKASLINKRSYKRFPNDEEFHREFVIKNVYNFRNRTYLLDKLENFSRKELANVLEYTIEHIMPQNPNLPLEWQEELGRNWQEIQTKYLHTIGNLTLTGYNPELSDKPFLEKQNMKGGFKDSPIRLNSGLAKLDHWNKEEITNRAEELADLAIKIWSYPHLPQNVLEKYLEIAEIDDDEEDEDEEKSEKITWSIKLERTTPEIRDRIEKLITKISSKFDCQGIPHGRWFYFHIGDKTESKTLFAVILCSKSTANICFRINPENFHFDAEMIRVVKGFFFPGSERRISLKDDNEDEILEYLEHAYKATKDFYDKEWSRLTNIAKKAVKTRKLRQQK